MDHPARARVAEIVVSRAEKEDTRGSGYLVSPGWVLTACHVVQDATSIGVWLRAPPELVTEEGVRVHPRRVLTVLAADLALLPLGGEAHDPSGEPALFGRLDREPGPAVPVAAAGCPRFKLRPAPARPGVLLRELDYALGSIAALSDAKTGRFAFVVNVPPLDPEPGEHSPWEGMSGAAVWASGRLIGVVGQHHPQEGLATLTVCPVEQLFSSASEDQLEAWRTALPQLPAAAEALRLAVPPTARKIEVARARRAAEALAPKVLIGRGAELAALEEFTASDMRWRWVQGDAFAGKTALMAWFTRHPPERVDVAACFLRRAIDEDTAAYALDVLTRQLALLADRRGYLPPPFVSERSNDFADLLDEAARACAERDRQLLVLIDGLDEYDPSTASIDLGDWLPGHRTLPGQAKLLAASRVGADVRLPPGHSLSSSVQRINASEAATEVQRAAYAELDRAVRTPGGFLLPLLCCLAAAGSGLTASDMCSLLKRRGRDADVSEIEAQLSRSLGRSLMRLPDPEGTEKQIYAFAHDTLLTEARSRFASDLATYEDLLDAWASEYAHDSWPSDTPQYLLAPFTRELARRAHGLGTGEACSDETMSRALDRLISFATDAARQDRMLAQTYGDGAALAEIATIRQLTLARRVPDLGVLGRVAVSQDRLVSRNQAVPVKLPALWVRLGQEHRARALARSSDPKSLAWALAQLAKALADTGQYDLSEAEADSIIDPQVQAMALGTVAAAVVAYDHGRAVSLASKAERVARDITDPKSRASALIAVAEAAVEVNRDLTMLLVGDAEDSLSDIWSPYRDDAVLVKLAKTLALTGQPDDRIQKTVQAAIRWLQPWILQVVVQAFADTGQLDRAELTAKRIGKLHESKAAKRPHSALGSPWRTAIAVPPHQIALAQADAFARLAEALATTKPDQAAAWAAAAEGAARSVEDFEFQETGLVAAIRALTVTGAWRHAEETARDLSDPALKVNALIAVADSLVSSNKARALTVMNEAESVARKITSSETKARALTAIADTVLTFDRNWAMTLAEAAEQAAHSGANPDHRTKAFLAVAKGLAAAGEWDRAESTARMIADSYSRDDALAAVAQHLADAREWDSAERIGRGVTRHRDYVFKALSKGLAAAGEWDRAESTARMIADSYSRDDALATVAQHLADTGKLKRAKRTIRAIKYASNRCKALTSIAHILVAARKWDSVERLGRDTECPDARVAILCNLAKALVNYNLDRALASIDEAGHIAYDITEDEIQSGALEKVAEAVATFGEWDRAREIIATMPYGSATATAALVEALVSAEEWNRAEQATRDITDEALMAKSLVQLGAALIGVDQGRGLALIVEAENIAQNARLPYGRPAALCAVTRALARGGQGDRAYEFLLNISNPQTKAEALGELIGGLATAEEWERANEIALADIGVPKDAGIRALVDALAAAHIWGGAANAAGMITVSKTQTAARLHVISKLMDDEGWGTDSQDDTLPVHARRLLAEILATGSWEEAMSPLGRLDASAVISTYEALRVLSS